jgi:hypothetical protein
MIAPLLYADGNFLLVICPHCGEKHLHVRTRENILQGLCLGGEYKIGEMLSSREMLYGVRQRERSVNYKKEQRLQIKVEKKKRFDVPYLAYDKVDPAVSFI